MDRSPPRRQVVLRSWQRSRAAGLRADAPNPRPAADAVDLRRPTLRTATDALRQVLPAPDTRGLVVSLADRRGVLLWRHGDPVLLRESARAGFVEGVRWDERSVGTNAIGLALHTGAPVRLLGGEHFESCQADWYCTAAPLPTSTWTDAPAVVNVGGLVRGFHPRAENLVTGLAALVAAEVRARRLERLDRLRARYAAHVAREPALLVDDEGLVAAAGDVPRHLRRARIAAPVGGTAVVPGHGACAAERLPGGWLVRLQQRTADGPVAARLHLGAEPRIVVAGTDVVELSRRQAELLLLLHLAGPAGLAAAALTGAFYGRPAPVVSVRAEVSRLRRALGPHAPLIGSRPYRIAPGYQLDPQPGRRTSPLVPPSTHTPTEDRT